LIVETGSGGVNRSVALGVAVLVVLAGCPGPDSEASADTLTPAPVPTTERPAPPGVTDDGVAARVLVDTHTDLLSTANYTIRVERRVTGPNGTLSTFEHVRRVAAGGEPYVGRYGRTSSNYSFPASTRRIEYWTDGDGYATRHSDGTTGRVLRTTWSSVGEPILDVDRSLKLFVVLERVGVRVADRSDGGVRLLGQRSGAVPNLPTPEFVREPRNAAVTASVTADGLVTGWRYAYDAESTVGPVRVLYDVTITDVGSTAVERPAWVAEARNGSAG
jgi:hypothetical protein